MSDSILLGSLHNYRLKIAQWEARQRGESTTDPNTQQLSLTGHTVAGVLAGWTVSFFISPIEMLKAKLQMQVRLLSPPPSVGALARWRRPRLTRITGLHAPVLPRLSAPSCTQVPSYVPRGLRMLSDGC